MVICMTQFFYFSATLLGGLGFFLYGMSTLSEGLKNSSSQNLEIFIKKSTSKDFKGFLFGALMTAMLQSSSALTVIIVGLVNSGLLNFESTFGLIMGSNVGTTLTAWIISFAQIKESNPLLILLNPEILTPLLSFTGVCLLHTSKSPKKRNLGIIFIGFSVLMYGMELMSGAINLLSDLKAFGSFLLTLKSPIFALIISAVFTGIIQSSAATIGIVEALTLSGDITVAMAIPLVLGANIGTCVTALISSLGGNKNAKRVVALHFAVNIIGSLICISALYLLKNTGFAQLQKNITMSGVALIHTLFNIISAIIFIPFKKALIKLCYHVVPVEKSNYLQNQSFIL